MLFKAIWSLVESILIKPIKFVYRGVRNFILSVNESIQKHNRYKIEKLRHLQKESLIKKHNDEIN